MILDLVEADFFCIWPYAKFAWPFVVDRKRLWECLLAFLYNKKGVPNLWHIFNFQKKRFFNEIC